MIEKFLFSPSLILFFSSHSCFFFYKTQFLSFVVDLVVRLTEMDETGRMSTESLDTFQALSDNDKLLGEYFEGANDVDTLPTTRSSATAIGNIVVHPLSPESLE